MPYNLLLSSVKTQVLIKEDEIHLVDKPRLPPLLKIIYYKYEDGYCIRVYKRLGKDTLSLVCAFKGEIKIEDNNKKVILIDYYQIPPIRPALLIMCNSKVDVYIRRDIDRYYGCPPPPGVRPRSWSEAMALAARKYGKLVK